MKLTELLPSFLLDAFGVSSKPADAPTDSVEPDAPNVPMGNVYSGNVTLKEELELYRIRRESMPAPWNVVVPRGSSREWEVSPPRETEEERVARLQAEHEEAVFELKRSALPSDPVSEVALVMQAHRERVARVRREERVAELKAGLERPRARSRGFDRTRD